MTAEPRRRGRYFSLRWKLVSAFAAAFTLVFAFIALWVVHNAGSAALKRVEEQLVDATQGTARDVPQAALRELLALPAGTDVTGLPAYDKVRRDLDSVRATLPEARPYIVAKGASGGLDYVLVPGQPFRDSVLANSPQETADYMLRAFDGTVYQGRNDDQFGQWVSAYSPIVDRQGQALAVVGMDFPLEYVRDVRTGARQRVFPVLIASYAALLGLVWLVSTLLVRPIRRITDASQRIAEGDYSQDLTRLTRGRYPDEMSDLADSFGVMVSKVAAREQELTSEVQRLRVQIDAGRREESVREITESEFFTELQAKAASMRARMRE